jgi:eukaryotic-like serine/threonine-protein kinase
MAQIRLGHYELGDLVGRGGMGQVHAARDPSGRMVVVKRLRNTLSLDDKMKQRFGVEGRVCRKVSHPNVVRVFEHGTTSDGSPFIVMDRARGKTLRQLVDDTGALPLPRIRALTLQLLDGLGAIHAAGIVHADIKSNNLIVDTADGTDHLTIIDFGLARTKTLQHAFDDGLVAGTPEFMAPELFRGAPPTPVSDIYAAAIIIYEMLAGETPFCGEPPMQILQRQMTEAVTFPPEARRVLSSELERILLRALDRNPQQRYQTVAEFAKAFDRATLDLVPEADAITQSVPAPTTITDMVPTLEPDDNPEIQRWRGELLDALTSSTPDPIIVAYLGLADALIGDSRMLDAVQELESAHALLVPRNGTPPRQLWRIALLLAAMYDRLGNRARARSSAMDAHGHATRVADEDGIARTRALLRRLSAVRGTLKPASENAPAILARATKRFRK